MTREEAIDFAEFLKNNWIINFPDMEKFCDRAIEALQAESKRGKWVLGDGYYCSSCGYKLQTTAILRFCPNCGAKMDKE